MRDPLIKLDVCVMLFFFYPLFVRAVDSPCILTLSFPEGYDVPIFHV